jgi:hypothetical protein
MTRYLLVKDDIKKGLRKFQEPRSKIQKEQKGLKKIKKSKIE